MTTVLYGRIPQRVKNPPRRDPNTSLHTWSLGVVAGTLGFCCDRAHTRIVIKLNFCLPSAAKLRWFGFIAIRLLLHAYGAA